MRGIGSEGSGQRRERVGGIGSEGMGRRDRVGGFGSEGSGVRILQKNIYQPLLLFYKKPLYKKPSIQFFLSEKGRVYKKLSTCFMSLV